MKQAPLLTVLMPTRNRPEMAIRAARSILSYAGNDIDLVILDNSDEPLFVPDDLRTDPRLQSVRSAKALGMADNWERGLDVASGYYITYVADKDVFLPSGIDLFLERLRPLHFDVICYRKGWYCEERKKVMLYHCEGGLTSSSTVPLLDTWFDDPRHLHSAPMVFNSAVSRELVNRIRSRTSRFFVGNSPDVCSGMLLSAYLAEYHQLDRMLSIAHGGAWSAGYASRRFGRGHPNVKAFYAEHGSNPIDALGLPATLGSAVVEIICAIQRDHPSAFGNRSINWRRYLQRAHQEIDELEIDESCKRDERRCFTTKRCVVPRGVVLRYRAERFAKQTLRNMQLVSLAKTFAKAAFSARPSIKSVRGKEDPAGNVRCQQPWDDAHRCVEVLAFSIEHAIDLAIATNPIS